MVSQESILIMITVVTFYNKIIECLSKGIGDHILRKDGHLKTSNEASFFYVLPKNLYHKAQ